MDNLPAITKQHNNLSISEKTFDSPKVIRLSDSEIKMVLLNLLTDLFYKCGNKITNNDLQLLVNNLATTLKKYAWITFKELELLFDNGRKKEYGEYFGLNINTFEMWIDAWDKKDRPKEMLSRKFDAPVIEQVMSEQDKEEVMRSAVERAKKEYQETGNLNAGAIGQYDWLDKNGKLLEAFKMSENDFKAFKLDIYKEVKESTKNILNGLKSHSIEEKRQIKQSLLDIEQNKSGEVISESKKVILRRYYKLK